MDKEEMEDEIHRLQLEIIWKREEHTKAMFAVFCIVAFLGLLLLAVVS